MNHVVCRLKKVCFSNCGIILLLLISCSHAVANPYPYADWMSTDPAIQSSTLAQISMIGAHDAGMHRVQECSAFGTVGNTRTQDKGILELLLNGVRYFDFRPRLLLDDRDEIMVGHYTKVGSGYEGCTGVELAEILHEIRAFMQMPNSREVVIVTFSEGKLCRNNWFWDNIDCRAFNVHDNERFKREIHSVLGNYLVRSGSLSEIIQSKSALLGTPISELTQDGPKVIVYLDMLKESEYGHIDFWERRGIYAKKEDKSDVPIDGQSTNTNDMNHLSHQQMTSLWGVNYEKGNNNASKFWLMHWYLTQADWESGNLLCKYTPDCYDLYEYSWIANTSDQLSMIVEWAKDSIPYSYYPNVILVNFANSEHHRLVAQVLNNNSDLKNRKKCFEQQDGCKYFNGGKNYIFYPSVIGN